MKTMRVHWAEGAIEQAVKRLETIVQETSTEATHTIVGRPLSWMDMACLLDMTRELERVQVEEKEARKHETVLRWLHAEAVWHAEHHRAQVETQGLSHALLLKGFRGFADQVDAMARKIREQEAELAELRGGTPARQPRVWDLADCESEPDDCTLVTDAASLLWTRDADDRWKAKDRLPITWWTLVRKRGPVTEVLEAGRASNS